MSQAVTTSTFMHARLNCPTQLTLDGKELFVATTTTTWPLPELTTELELLSLIGN